MRVLLSIGPGEEMDLLKGEFEEFIKGLICLPIKLPGTRLYKSLQVNIVSLLVQVCGIHLFIKMSLFK